MQDYLVGETIFDSPDHKVKYAGSGTFHFFEIIDIGNMEPSSPINEFESCVANFLARAAIAFYSEIVSEDTHNYHYGGGFELLTLNSMKQSYEKLSFASAFWQATGEETLRLIGPIFTNQYDDDNNLIISRIHYDNNQPILTRFVISDIFSMFKAPDSKRNLPKPNFDPHFVIHYIIDEDGDEIRLILKKGKDKGVTFSMDDLGKFYCEFANTEFFREALNLSGDGPSLHQRIKAHVQTQRAPQ